LGVFQSCSTSAFFKRHAKSETKQKMKDEIDKKNWIAKKMKNKNKINKNGTRQNGTMAESE